MLIACSIRIILPARAPSISKTTPASIAPGLGLDAQDHLGHFTAVHNQRLVDVKRFEATERGVGLDFLDLRVADHGSLEAVVDPEERLILGDPPTEDCAVIEKDRVGAKCRDGGDEEGRKQSHCDRTRACRTRNSRHERVSLRLTDISSRLAASRDGGLTHSDSSRGRIKLLPMRGRRTAPVRWHSLAGSRTLNVSFHESVRFQTRPRGEGPWLRLRSGFGVLNATSSSE